MTSETSVYERLGGRDAIDAVVDEFYDRVLADERVEHFFADTDVDRLRAHQKRFIASATGGPIEYDGRTMAAAHRDLDIGEADFEIIATHLDEALAAFDVPADDREAVLETVADLKPAIVSA